MSFLVTWVHPQQNPRFCLQQPVSSFFSSPAWNSFFLQHWLGMVKYDFKTVVIWWCWNFQKVTRFDSVWWRGSDDIEATWRCRCCFIFLSEDQLLKKVCKLANALRAEGVKKGDRPGFLVVWDGDSKSRFFFLPKKWPPPMSQLKFLRHFCRFFFLHFFFVRNICFHLGCNGICDTLDMFFFWIVPWPSQVSIDHRV